MLKLLRKILINTIGFDRYVRLASRTYLRLVGAGFLKNKYPELFYLKQLIKPGYYCLDIGANLGYYSTFLSKLAGKTGKVLAVEPIPDFQEIWKENVKLSGTDNLELYPYALGSENTTIQMGTPERDGVLRHGLTKVVNSDTGQSETYGRTYDVPMRVPDELFINLPRLDFIKCDVEGFEFQVFVNMQGTLRKFKPVIQTELNGEQNRRQVTDLLTGLGYSAYILSEDNTLVQCSAADVPSALHSDFYFKVNQ